MANQCTGGLMLSATLLQHAPPLQVLLAAMQSQLLGDSRVANTLIPRVCNAVLAAPSSTRHVSCCVVGVGVGFNMQGGADCTLHTFNMPPIPAPCSCWSSGGRSTRRSCWRHGW